MRYWILPDGSIATSEEEVEEYDDSDYTDN